jgi:hypothetical protein
VNIASKILGRSIVLAGLIALLVHPGSAAVVTFTELFEGASYRLLDPNGNDINNIVLGSVGLCEPGILCNADTLANGPVDDEGNTDRRSDNAVWAAINNAAGARIGTSLTFCSDPGDPGGEDVVIPGCTELWATHNLFINEVAPVKGVELTPYTPTANQPGFWPGNTATYDLISDTPEPSSFFLFGTSILGVWGALRMKRRRS